MPIPSATLIPGARTNDIEKAVINGVNYLHQHQFPNGEFCIYISGDDPMTGGCTPDSNVFPTAIISHCLLPLSAMPQVDEMLEKSARFLYDQMGWGASWNYYTKYHALRSICPSDVDDTCYAAAFLSARKVDFPEAATRPLVLSNRNKEGLFYTWFTFRLRWNTNRDYWRLVKPELKQPLKSFIFWLKNECGRYDVDGVVNANVLYFLRDTEVTQPVIRFLLQIIADKKEDDCDKWYRNPLSVYYFISRNYDAGIRKLEPARQPVIDRILAKAQQDGRLGSTVLDTALAACTLLNFHYKGEALDRAIAFLLATQRETGEWERWRLYGGPSMSIGWGSEELTTGFCLEALARYNPLSGYLF